MDGTEVQDMVEEEGGDQAVTEPIYARHSKLRSILTPRRQRRGRPRHDNGSPSGLEDFSVEVLLDSFLALYDSWDKRNSKGSYEQFFVAKYGRNVGAIRKSTVGIGDFELGSTVGRGRFGEVMVAKENGTGRVYAIKVFRKSDPLVQANISGIDAELQILLGAKSPFLVSLKYSFHDPENLYFAMEYMPGGDLSSLLKRCNGQMPEDHLRFYLAELLLAINSVHGMGFAYRDIKPENILFDRHGHLKLCDFGSSVRISSEGRVIGKLQVDQDPLYVAPEILESLEDDDEKSPEGAYGIECDYWSFGVMAFTCCFGFNPFKGESALETFRNVVSYKTSFTIPRGSCASTDFQLIMKELVTDPSSRIGYQQLLRHPFFNSIIWDGIQHDVPPYIPTIISDDDASNFTPTSRSAFSGATKDGGNQFSFVGFTRTLQEVCPSFNVSFNSTANSSCNSVDTSMIRDDKIGVSQLRAELTTKDEFLAQRNAEILNLENKVEEYEAAVAEKDLKLAKNAAEIKRLLVEKDQIAKELQDERDYRKELEDKSQNLVVGIRATQQSKLAEVESEIDMLKQKIATRDEQLDDLQETMKKLRAENIHLGSQLEKEQSNAKYKENNARANRSYRGSISMLESRLETSTLALESRIQQLNQQHENDLEDLRSKHEETEKNYQDAIDRYKNEVNDLIGRLEESRRSREATLEDYNQLYREYLHMKQRLEAYVDELEAQVKKLTDEKEAKEKHVESELERTRCDRDRLSIRVETLESEVTRKEDKICQLSDVVSRLEKSLRDFDSQKEETKVLLTKAQECSRQEGAVSVLQEQLQKFQELAEANRECLFQEKHKYLQLERKSGDLEKELTVVKLDLKFATKDKKSAEAQLERIQVEKTELSDTLKVVEEERTKFELSFRSAEKEIETLKMNLHGMEFNFTAKSKLVEELKKDQEAQASKYEEIRRELDQCRQKLDEYEALRLRFIERETEMRVKDEMLDEKDRKIYNLQTTCDALKEGITLLEDQLKDLDKIIANNNNQTSEHLRAKANLEAEKAALQDELKAARTTVNELRSMKTFDEQQLKHITAALKAEESRRKNEVDELTEKLRDVKEANEEMAFRLAELEGNLEELTVVKSTTETAFGGLKRENQVLREENARNMKQIVRMKERSLELQSALEEALSKAEGFKSRWEAVTEEKMMLEAEKMEVEAQLQATFSQQVKLVEYLQDKCSASAAAKKKKIFPTKIFCKDKIEPVEQDLLKMILSTPPTVTTSHHVTPLSLRNMSSSSTPISQPAATSSPITTGNFSAPHPNSKVKLHPVLEEALSEERQLIQELEMKSKELTNLLTQQQLDEENKENVTSPLPVADARPLEPSFKTQTLFEDTGKPEERCLGAVNCVRELGKDLYLIGADNGLFSRKLSERVNACVKIDGVENVHQIEFLYQENLAILIQGEIRKLVSIPYGMLEACAKAAACSKPEVSCGQESLGSLTEVNYFRVQKKKSKDGHIIVAVLKNSAVVFDWHKTGFVLKHRLETPEGVSCALTQFDFCLLACCGRVYQLSLHDFSLLDFMQDADEATGYALDDGSNGPITILDVGRSNLARGETVYRPEYLICFSDFAIFVDSHGRRSRSECILWNKVPLGVEYHHPNLYVTHFNSIEVLQLDEHSFTTSRQSVNRSSPGEEATTLPESCELSDMINPQIVGLGARASSVIVVTDDKDKATIVDVNAVSAAEYQDSSSIFSQQSVSSLMTGTSNDSTNDELRSKSSTSSLSSAGRAASVWKSQRSSVLLPFNQNVDRVPLMAERINSNSKVEFGRRGAKVRFTP